MKKFLSSFLTALLLLSIVLTLAACGEEERITTAEEWSRVIENTRTELSKSDANFMLYAVPQEDRYIYDWSKIVVRGNKIRQEWSNALGKYTYYCKEQGETFKYTNDGNAWQEDRVGSSSGTLGENFVSTVGYNFFWTLDAVQEDNFENVFFDDGKYSFTFNSRYFLGRQIWVLFTIKDSIITKAEFREQGFFMESVTFIYGGQSVTLPMIN